MNNQVIDKLKDTFKGPILKENEDANIAKSERVLSVAAGAFVLFQGLTSIFSHPILALGEIALGGTLIQRGVTGTCPVISLLEEQAAQPVPVVVATTDTTSVSQA